MKFIKTWKKVLTDEKTVTRRSLWSSRFYREGMTTPVKDGLGRTHGRVLIKKIREERLDDISFEDCIREGVGSQKEFKELWKSLHRRYDPNQIVRVIEFELIEKEGEK